MRKVKLYGNLADKYGKEFMLNADSPKEAIRLLVCNFGNEFREVIRKGMYQVCVGPIRAEKEEDLNVTNQLSEREVALNFNKGDFHFTPVAEGAGSGKGWLQITLGVALIVVGSYVPVVGTYMQSMGVGMILMGASTLLFSPPGMGGPTSEFDRPEANKSFLFRSALNTLEQGGCVAVNVGKFIAGSVVIATALEAEDIS